MKLYGTLADTKRVRDLGDAETLDIKQRERESLLTRKRCEQRDDIRSV